MPNYPNSAPSFTTKNTGDTVQAAHINDLQDEVVAVGSDLVDGNLRHDLTPSTTSTRALGSATRRWRLIHGTSGAFDRLESTSLSVTGNSTIEALTVSSAFTLGGGLQSSNSTVNALQISSNCTIAGRLQSSNSTVNALQVSSNCTVSGGWQSSNSTCTNLQVTANSTMGRLTVSSAAPSAPDTNSVYANTIIKAWASFSTAPALLAQVNVSSFAFGSTDLYTVAFGTALASSNYAVVATLSDTHVGLFRVGAKATTGFQLVGLTSSNEANNKGGQFIVVGG